MTGGEIVLRGLQLLGLLGEASIAHSDHHAAHGGLGLDGKARERILINDRFGGLADSGVAAHLAEDHRAHEEDAEHRRDGELGTNSQVLDGLDHYRMS